MPDIYIMAGEISTLIFLYLAGLSVCAGIGWLISKAVK